jgi:hypothetical protein
VGEVVKDYKCFFNCLTSDVTGVQRDIVCEDSSGGPTLRLDVSTMHAVSVSYDYTPNKKYEMVVEVVGGKLRRTEKARLEDSLPYRKFRAIDLNNCSGEVTARKTSIAHRQEVDFYYVGDDKPEGADVPPPAPADGDDPASLMIEDNTHMGRKKRWYPGKMLFRGGKAAAGTIINTVGHTVSATKNVVSSVAVVAGSGVVHGE